MQTVKLNKGELTIYSKNGLELINYNTLDPIGDQVILIKDKDNLVSIEAPLLKDNVAELNSYIDSLNVKNKYILLVCHVAPRDYLKDAKVVTTKYAVDELKNGTPNILFNNFYNTFNGLIAKELREDYEIIDNLKVGNIELDFINKGHEFDVVIKGFNAVYTHMLGHDVHSIIAGQMHAKAIIDELNSFINNGYELFLTSHYTPEVKEDVLTKIDYVNNIVKLASESQNKEEFLTKVKETYPNYSGLNYLDMTANSFFNN